MKLERVSLTAMVSENVVKRESVYVMMDSEEMHVKKGMFIMEDS